MDKNQKDIVFNSSDISQLEMMMNEFKEAIDKVNEKYEKLTECNIIFAYCFN